MQKFSAATLRLFLFFLCLCAVAFPQARPITSADVSLVSVGRTGGAGNASSYRPDISADGRYVVFRSLATDLVDLSDTNRAADIFVRDIVAGTTRLVSVNRDGTAAGNGESGPMVISANGRYVAFTSEASDLVANDTNGFRGADVFLRDLQAETTTLVSVNTSGSNSFGFLSMDFPSISADGRFVAFSSGRGDLANDIKVSNIYSNIYVRDMVKGITLLASPNFAGTDGNANGGASLPTISAEGRYVAFASGATDLVPNDTNGMNGFDVFIRDLVAGKTWLASRNANGTASGNDVSYTPRISADGHSVVFASRATNLFPNDANGFPDYFVYNLDTNTTSLVTINSANTASGRVLDNEGFSVTDYDISGDGRFVVFWSPAVDLTPNDNNGCTDIFVRDLSLNRTTLVSVNTAETVSGNNHSTDPQISRDGRYVLFRSLATDLATNHGNARVLSDDLFVRDLQNGHTNLVSVNTSGVASGLVASYWFKISSNGQYAAFTTPQSDLGATDTNGVIDVYLTKMLDAPALPPSIQFGASGYTLGEGTGRAELIVTRSGDLSAGATISYATIDDPAAVPCDPTIKKPDGTLYPQGVAYARCDYSTTVGVLSFAPGEASKLIHVPLVNDAHVEAPEVFQVRLFDPAGASLGAQGVATLTITDDDAQATQNPIYNTAFFVRMHYLDFLSREPEANEPWSAILNNCPNVFNLDAQNPSAGCDRLIVSQSFFGSPEFRLKGFFVFNFYKVAFGRLPDYAEIVPDMSGVTGATAAEVFARRAALPVNFTARPEFKALYDGLSDAAYVNALLERYGLEQIHTADPQQPEAGTRVVLTRGDLINRLGLAGAQGLTRAQVLRALVESDEVGAAEYNRAFVAMQYYGYLRRTPEESGYQAWLRVINQDPNNVRIMVNGFLNSTEYRLRFGQP